MNTKCALFVIALCGIFAITSCSSVVKSERAAEQTSSQIQTTAFDIGSKVANWQIEHLDNFDYLEPRYRKGTAEPRNWIQASFYIGLTKWTETVSDSKLLNHIKEVAESVDYSFRTKRDRHADDHAIGQTYLWLAEQTGNPKTYEFTQKEFDRILATPSYVDLELKEVTPKIWGYEGPCQDRWCWADALFMAPRTWLKLSNVTGNDKYFKFADQEFWATAQYLFSDEYGLFYRDSRYFDSKSDNGKPVFWSRGNGWVFAALPLIIDDLPQHHPSRERYLTLYKKNAAGLQRLQNDNGYWPASLLDPDKVKSPEMSGTAFITFGLAWGVNNGVLKDKKYKETVLKGWKAIEQGISENGRVNYVQQVGKSPDPVKKEDTQLYGVGAVLLAASEMTKWAQ
ncbi:glycoside hydrolase family 105 protein [Glaciecola sp. KUL10]|uniref:glycoside hydrolase family 88/105 protein n=1 Tax=Glaciecola sp. (strain KUL10) TaxID=2161813 RepID=UPI000D782B88|nr:glycoside hydrolase family 88 protein [Glaciecola sp. KUL10]GBL05357.1 hypothetical protein KUL10_26770 [Glaciecola sp. KUL10]